MTRKAFVIGHPIAHSRSPLIHGHWLKRYGIDGSYVRVDVAPDALPGFFANLRDGAFVGGNITIPHKQAAFDLCDAIDPVARTIGAVNTVFFDGDALRGTNTDWYGFLANLDAERSGWDETPGPAVILGAGGAARGIALGLVRRGFSPIHILNRTPATAVRLAAELGPALDTKMTGAGLDSFAILSEIACLVVNTSSVGMHGTAFDNLPLDRLPKQALVADIVYTPLETPLLASARALGLETVDGLGMLLHQAVPGFEAWFGVRPEVTPALRALVEKEMGLK